MTSEPAIWLVREGAESIAEKLTAELGGTIYRPWLEPGYTQKEIFQAAFMQHSSWVLVMATGIAVRFLEGLTRDKHSDPAVVVLDEGCRYAIALLSGHEGGANELAVAVSNVFGAVPVITTATEATKPLVVGIGCRKGVRADQIEEVVQRALGDYSLDQVREIATVDLKKNEPGLIEFAKKYAIPIRCFFRDDVAGRNWVTEKSEWVKESIGLDGVCEPCALMANPRGKLVVAKTTACGVAVAIVEDSSVTRSFVVAGETR
jgi:cobalt-precorrin 5A hydrolase